jgi:hypothetical protein
MAQPPYVALLEVLKQKAGFETLTHTPKEAQLRITGRCHPDRWGFFLPVIYTLQRTADKDGSWSCDISKQYFIRNDRIVYCWRLIFQSDNINEKYSYLANVVRGAPNPTRVEVEEVLLPGYKVGDIRGGVNEKGKGVSSADSAPMILSRRK